jgi:hypothetical protein
MRSVFLHEGSIIICRPIAKKLDIDRDSSFWALPPKMTNPFLVFTGIIKLVGQHILTKAGMTIPLYDTELFVHYTPQPRKKEPHRFNGADCDAAIREFTDGVFGVALNSRVLCQMAKAVFRSQLPQLFSAAFQLCPPHGAILAQKQSPFDNLLPSFEGSKIEASHQITISQIWHAIHGLGLVNNEWRVVLQENHILPSHKYDGIAWERARSIINAEYGVGGRDVETIVKTVNSVLDRKPFLIGDKVSIWFLFY